jgi:predicted N-formylglutamate amidohydrolase
MSARAPLFEPVVTCEHASNHVPARWQSLFCGDAERLASHRGWDPGARPLARMLARELGVPLIEGRTTRLLVELNRSPGHRQWFSDRTAPLPPPERARIVRTVYEPYREAVRAAVDAAAQRGRRVAHLSVHTFTPVLDGVVRDVEIGLLFDLRRAEEAAFCRAWQLALRARLPDMRIRRNAPYRGRSDACITWLRRQWSGDRYLGIEIEVNQALATAPGATRSPWARALAETFAALLATRSRSDFGRASPG